MNESHASQLQARPQGMQAVGQLQPIALRAMFWRPDYLVQSDWLEHIPVAFWLVEAQQPRVLVEIGAGQDASYFAFCQAVDRLGLDTRCFSLPGWTEAERASLPAGAAERFRAHNDARYSSFSRQLRGDQDEMLAHFTDASVDLLHLDARRSYADIGRMLQQWRPKLSARAVLVLHYTLERSRDCGVHRLLAELAAEHPTFEFMQAEGLAVVGMGPEQGEMLGRLFSAASNEGASKSVQEVFSRLGRACTDSFVAVAEQARARELGERLQDQEQQIDQLRQGLEQSRREVGERGIELAQAQARMQVHVEQQMLERGHLAERLNLLQELREEFKQQALRMQSRVDAMQGEVDQRAEQLRLLAGENSAHRAQVEASAQAIQAREAEVSRLQAQLEARDQAVARLGAELADLRRETEQASQADSSREQALEALRDQLAAAEQRADRSLRKLSEEKLALEAEVARLAEASQSSSERDSVLLRLRAEAEKRLTESLAQLREEKQALEAETASLTEALKAGKKAYDAELVQLRNELQAARAEAEASAQVVADRNAELQRQSGEAEAARRVAGEKELQIGQLMGQLSPLEQRIQRLERQLAEATLTLQGEPARISEQLDAIERRHAQSQGAAADAAQSREAALKSVQAALDAAAEEVERLKQAVDVAQGRERALAAQAQALTKQLEEARQALATAEASQQASLKARDAQELALSEQLAALKQRYAEAAEAYQTSRDQQAARRQELMAEASALRRSLDEATRARGELAQRLEQVETERTSALAHAAKLQQVVESSRVELEAGHAAALAALRDQHEANVAELRQAAAASQAEFQRQLEASHADLRRVNEGGKAMVQRLAAAVSTLRAEKATLEKQHLDETAAAEASARRHAAELDSLKASMQAQADTAIAAAKKHHHAELASVRATLEARVQALQRAGEESARSLEARFRELASLTRGLAERDDRNEALAAELAALRGAQQRLLLDLGRRDAQVQAMQQKIDGIQRSSSWRLTAPLRAVARPFHSGAAAGADAEPLADGAMGEELAMLRASELLDAEWYRATYPDVRSAQADPAQHYLLHGAAEGRNPSPDFDTSAYLRRYPDVVEAGINPLVHYLGFGKQEGRLPK